MPASRRALIAVILGVAALGSARAADEEVAEVASAQSGEGSLLTRTAGLAALVETPRLTRTDHLDGSTPAAAGLRGETNEIGYRWSLSRGRADLGLGLGMLAYVDRPTGALPGLGGESNGRVLASATVVTLGMRYRTSDRSALYADAAGLRAPGGIDGSDGAVVGKVGMEFQAAQSRWNVSYGGLGLRLAGDARINVKLRRGGLGLFMHRAF
ncbi:MAG TPA: hypothetical protein VNU71_00205 [Burkholderiaceae bacterium]|nr:hypothetical protein [Burkholderiaceae bacterium]